jgi:hypothetical protein
MNINNNNKKGGIMEGIIDYTEGVYKGAFFSTLRRLSIAYGRMTRN